MNSRVTYQVDGSGIAEVILNRPDKLNALDLSMFKAIDNTIKQIKKDKRVRVVIVRGAGDDFCTGLDTKSVLTSASNAVKLLFKWWPSKGNLAQRVSQGWRGLSVPVIMAIHGRCWGGGMQIALGGDFRIAQQQASLSIMEAKWGLIPDMGGNMVLRQLMPVDQAMELTMTAKVLNAAQAKQLNLVTHTADDVLTAARELAVSLLSTSPDVLAATKKLYLNNWCRPDGAFLAKESWYQIKVLSGKNQRIAVKKARGQEAEFQPRGFG